jgi:putative endopeptidase
MSANAWMGQAIRAGRIQMMRRPALACAAIISLVALVLAQSGVNIRTAVGPRTNAEELTAHSVGAWGLDLNDRDPSVKPGDNFYMSQNGAWFARTELGAQRPMAAYWFDLRTLAPRQLKVILEELAADTSALPESPKGKAGAFYRAFMDEKTVEAKGLTPLKPELDAIRAAKTKEQMASLMGRMASLGTLRSINSPTGRGIGRAGAFSVSIQQDQKDPRRYAVGLGQSGLNLPGPEYYLDPSLADIKSDYEIYVAKMLALLNWPGAASRAKEIVALETRIAEVSWSHEQMADSGTTYNQMTVAELARLAPAFDWRAFLKGAELGRVDHVVVDAKSAFPKIATIFAETPTEVWQARQAFAVADDAAGIGYLNTAAFNLNFDFRYRQFNNAASAMRPRTFPAYFAAALNLGDIVSSLYVARYFPPEAKTAAVEMTGNLRQALDARLAKLPWMSAETRARARDKLAKMTMRIGYPDKFEDYKGLEINDTDLYGNVMRASAFDWRRQVRQLNQPFDRSAWAGAAEFANYRYIPTTNSIEIPAGLLQPPFFDLHADPAVNYGAVGTLMGLSILNGFNNQGRHYDGDGRLRDWWTAEEVKTFTDMTKRLADQYSAIEPLPGVHVKGELIVHESMSDIGGLLIALDAYHLSLKGQPAPVIDGFTGDQRVFLGWAQMWRAKFDPAFVRNQLVAGANSPPFLRVNGPVRNIDAWYEAFGVKPGDKLYLTPEERVHIW